MGLNSVLRMGAQAIQVFSAGIHVAGQNVSNANNPDYIRERLNLSTGTSYRIGNLVYGTGATADGIKQQINIYLETRLHHAASDFSEADARSGILKTLELRINELGESDLSTAMNHFVGAIENATNQPESTTMRQAVVEQGNHLANHIGQLRTRVNELRVTQTVRIDQLVNEANRLIDTVADLNPKIVQLEASGLLQSDAGTLRSQRYAALNRLAEIVPIDIRERGNGEFDVSISGHPLIVGGTSQHLESFRESDREVQVSYVRLADSNFDISSMGGEIGGIIAGRDTDVGGFVDDLDTYASGLIFEFNKIHAAGEGLRGFESTTSEWRVDDTTTALNTAATGLGFSPEHGRFELKVTNTLTGITETSTIDIDLDGIGTDTTLESLNTALNAVTNVSSTITTTNRLQINSETGYEFRFSNDTSGALAALGINTFFSGSDSTDVAVNEAVASDHTLLALGQGGGPSDNSNAALMSRFHDQQLTSLKNETLVSFYETVVSNVAQTTASETTISEGLDGYKQSLLTQRQQFSGVSLDEEAVQLLEFQHAFQAAARLISTADELFTVLLNI